MKVGKKKKKMFSSRRISKTLLSLYLFFQEASGACVLPKEGNEPRKRKIWLRKQGFQQGKRQVEFLEGWWRNVLRWQTGSRDKPVQVETEGWKDPGEMSLLKKKKWRITIRILKVLDHVAGKRIGEV